MPMKFSVRRASRALAKLAVAGLALFLLLEVSARVYLFGLAGLVPARVNSVHGLQQTGYTLPSRQKGLPFELKPNVDGHFKLARFVTNSDGLRDKEYALEKPANTFRVAVCGSSFALPAGVAIEDAFHSRLEERLSREFAPTRVEFINFAVSTYDAGEVLRVARQRALDYDPDLILFTTTAQSSRGLLEVTEDDEAERETGEKRAPIVGREERFAQSYPFLQSFFIRLIQLRTADEAIEPGVYIGTLERFYMSLVNDDEPESEAPRAPSERERKAGARRARRAERAESVEDRGSPLVRMGRMRANQGVPIALVRLEYDASPRNETDLEIERVAQMLGVKYFDTRDAFAGRRARDFWLYDLDPHPNARAHIVFTDAIDGFLRSSGLLSELIEN